MLLFESLADLDEIELVRRLLADSHWRGRILNLEGIPSDVVAMPEVSRKGLSYGEGDVDILLAEPGSPDRAIAIQVKRIKVDNKSLVESAPKKMSGLDKLKHQIRTDVDLGFSQCYGFVFVVVDSREFNQGAFTYSGLTDRVRRIIEGKMADSDIHPLAGLAHFQFVQPMDDRPLSAGSFSARVKGSPTVRDQPAQLTAWVQKQLDDFSNGMNNQFSATN